MTLASDAFDLNKRAFLEMLERDGITIENIYGMRKQCITSPIERQRSQQAVALFGQAQAKVDMLLSDYNEMILSPQERVIIDGTEFVILVVNNDPVDPCVHFTVIGD